MYPLFTMSCFCYSIILFYFSFYILLCSPGSTIQNSESAIQNPDTRTQNPEPLSRIQSPESRIQNPGYNDGTYPHPCIRLHPKSRDFSIGVLYKISQVTSFLYWSLIQALKWSLILGILCISHVVTNMESYFKSRDRSVGVLYKLPPSNWNSLLESYTNPKSWSLIHGGGGRYPSFTRRSICNEMGNI